MPKSAARAKGFLQDGALRFDTKKDTRPVFGERTGLLRFRAPDGEAAGDRPRCER
jgi:hypothetical protein